MTFYYPYTICLGDTDAAGVMYFANTLHLCHIAYEAALGAMGLPLQKFLTDPEHALPITHCSAQFRRPLRCSDHIVVQVNPQCLGIDDFEVMYSLSALDGSCLYAQAQTHHTCIHPVLRQRDPLRMGLLG
ncbi:MAG: 1,4-dihydroxy-2-naphthoyl-CoA hydrolase, partial [Spirulina sp. SIO3F2]|nr:1,4-dihydroxy-2-naphthoyl-CoA hydrolase [Spirulina sp. SIO3F2]